MSKVNYKPLNGIILIKEQKIEVKKKTTASGIIIENGNQAATRASKTLRGEIVAVPENVTQVKVGDIVDWQPFRNTPTEIDGETYQKVPFEELHGILND
jgi:co-chaperonin GroES (HSP10)